MFRVTTSADQRPSPVMIRVRYRKGELVGKSAGLRCEFESRQERRENCLLQSLLCVRNIIY